jgi:hypothetical protein
MCCNTSMKFHIEGSGQKAEPIFDPFTLEQSRMAQLGRREVYIGQADRDQKQLQLDESGLAFVGMNQSGRLKLEPGEKGLAVTTGLGGCTGVAGFAKLSDGASLQFISHYDGLAQTYEFTGADNPINEQMYGFRFDATKQGLEGPLHLFVAYPSNIEYDPRYGVRWGGYWLS